MAARALEGFPLGMVLRDIGQIDKHLLLLQKRVLQFIDIKAAHRYLFRMG